MTDYKPNSHKFKEEQQSVIEPKQVKKVVKGTAKVKKKSEISKFARAFVSEDAPSVGSYIVSDVLLPAAKKLISDIVTDGISMLLYGTTSRSTKASIGSKVSYRNYYDSRDNRQADNDNRAKGRFDYDDIIYETRGDAEAALAQMEEIIDRYGFVTVADMYDQAELTAPYTSNKYGWSSVRSVEPVRLRDGGYILKLPKAFPIDN